MLSLTDNYDDLQLQLFLQYFPVWCNSSQQLYILILLGSTLYRLDKLEAIIYHQQTPSLDY